MAHVVFKHGVFSFVIFFLFCLFEVGHAFSFLKESGIFQYILLYLIRERQLFLSLLYGLIINFIIFSA